MALQKGVTPVIAIIVLLFITIALIGVAYTFMQGLLFAQISKSFQIPTNGVYCENGIINVYVVNTAYQGDLIAKTGEGGDFIMADIDGQPANLTFVTIPQGEARRVISDDNAGNKWKGYHTVNLGTTSTIVHERVFCP